MIRLRTSILVAPFYIHQKRAHYSAPFGHFMMEASRMSDQLRELVSELDRQAQECTRFDTGASGEATEGLFTLHSQGADYARALRELQSSVAECLAENRDWRAITIPDESPLWKVCAFSRSSARIADPTFMRKRITTFLKLVDRQSNNDDIQGIWENKAIENWVTSDTPSALFLEIPFRGTGRVRRFALDLIDHLDKHHPVLSMIGGLSQADADHLLPDPTPKTVLEHLIVQALRHDNPEIRLGFFARTLSSFRASKTAGDLLGLLKAVCTNISKLTIVLDLSIFSSRLEEGMDAASWPTEFSRLVTGLWECSCPVFCHVLLLGSVRPTAEIVSKGTVISVAISAMDFGTSRRRFPFRPPRPVPKAYEASKSERSLISRSLKATLSREEPNQVAVSQIEPQATSNRDPILPNLNVPPPNAGYASDPTPAATYSREHVRVAICCALPLEADAVQAVFDKCLDDDLDQDKMRSSGDTTAYTFGIIGRHFTVLVHMPGMGRTNGAIVATKCQANFPNIKLALVVGICGGVPFYGTERTEIILGDVVISEGLYGYDFGRRFPDEFVVKNSADDIFARPSPEVRSILSKLKSRHNHRKFQSRTNEYLRQIQRDPDNRAHYPGAKEDQLFPGTYVHMHRGPRECNKCSDASTVTPIVCPKARTSTCGELACDSAMLVTRSRLNVIWDHPDEARPMIHFGKVACGDQVMKSGEHRDAIAKDSGAIAFEMEGAGIWDSFSCLVIKGVCDYADSHKHKKWQYYAAATAASCAKSFLQECYL